MFGSAPQRNVATLRAAWRELTVVTSKRGRAGSKLQTFLVLALANKPV